MGPKFNYTKLRERIRKKYETQEDFAQTVGISPIMLTAKLNNADGFTLSEIDTIRGFLGIQIREIRDFFYKELKKSTK
jgi:transcriptional regulator with XRE-family HTH domain